MPLISQLTPPDLGLYLDYRKYLADYYEFKKNQMKGNLRSYQYSHFAAAADIKSPNYLKMIIEGKRNLSEDMILKFAKALHLTKDQTEEFRMIVFLTQESDPSVRNQHLRDLNELRVLKSIEKGQIDSKTFDKIPNWVGWIIYSMLDQEGVQFNVQELKELLRQKAKENEIEEALNKLITSGEIVKDPVTGEYKKGRALIENPEDIPVSLIRKLQAQLMYLGLESLFQDQATDREFGTLTLCLTQQEFEDLRFQLRKMRKQIHKDNTIHRLNKKGDRIFQLNLQLFPVTAKKSKDLTMNELSSSKSGSPLGSSLPKEKPVLNPQLNLKSTSLQSDNANLNTHPTVNLLHQKIDPRLNPNLNISVSPKSPRIPNSQNSNLNVVAKALQANALKGTQTTENQSDIGSTNLFDDVISFETPGSDLTKESTAEC